LTSNTIDIKVWRMSKLPGESITQHPTLERLRLHEKATKATAAFLLAATALTACIPVLRENAVSSYPEIFDVKEGHVLAGCEEVPGGIETFGRINSRGKVVNQRLIIAGKPETETDVPSEHELTLSAMSHLLGSSALKDGEVSIRSGTGSTESINCGSKIKANYKLYLTTEGRPIPISFTDDTVVAQDPNYKYIFYKVVGKSGNILPFFPPKIIG
jgi:hypothetical protein